MTIHEIAAQAAKATAQLRAQQKPEAPKVVLRGKRTNTRDEYTAGMKLGHITVLTDYRFCFNEDLPSNIKPSNKDKGFYVLDIKCGICGEVHTINSRRVRAIADRVKIEAAVFCSKECRAREATGMPMREAREFYKTKNW